MAFSSSKSSSTSSGSSASPWAVVIRGVPFSASRKDFLAFFAPLKVMLRPAGRSTLLFASSEDAQNAAKHFHNKTFALKAEFGVTRQVKYLSKFQGSFKNRSSLYLRYPPSASDADLSLLLKGLRVSEIRHIDVKVGFASEAEYHQALQVKQGQPLALSSSSSPTKPFVVQLLTLEQFEAKVRTYEPREAEKQKKLESNSSSSNNNKKKTSKKKSTKTTPKSTAEAAEVPTSAVEQKRKKNMKKT